jgi:hypothetical protein
MPNCINNRLTEDVSMVTAIRTCNLKYVIMTILKWCERKAYSMVVAQNFPRRAEGKHETSVMACSL